MSRREWESGFSRRLIVGLCLLPLLVLGVRGLGWYFIPSPPPTVGMTSEEFEEAIQATGVGLPAGGAFYSVTTYETSREPDKIYVVYYQVDRSGDSVVTEWHIKPRRSVENFMPLRTWTWFW